MEAAERATAPPVAHQNHLNARIVYDAVLSLLAKLPPNAAQHHEITGKLAILQMWLQTAGQ